MVVGAGVFGAWTAYHLKRSGARVLLIDQHGAGNSRSSSSGETRIIRMSYGASEIYTRSSMRSLELWKGVCPALFHNTGVLVTAAPSDPYLIDTRETLSRCGVRHERLSAQAMRKRFPQITLDRDTEGIWEPDSGVLMARRAVQAVVEASGVDYEIRAGSKNIRAGTVVYACGPWLPKLVSGDPARPHPSDAPGSFFLRHPARLQVDAHVDRVSRRRVFDSGARWTRDSKSLSTLTVRRSILKPASREITQAALRKTRAVLRKRFPALARAPLVETRVCQYENTSNGDFLIDRHPHRKNVWLVGGGSGHGFKHGPWVGEYVASQIAGTAPAEPRFSLVSKKTTRQRSVY